MTIVPFMAMIALAQTASFQGGFHDEVGNPTSRQLTRLIIDVPDGALPIRSCKDDCVRASLDAVTVESDRVVFEISVTESYADRIVRAEKVTGECPPHDLSLCAGQARMELSAFAAVRYQERRP
jgi:hypothetical protein